MFIGSLDYVLILICSSVFSKKNLLLTTGEVVFKPCLASSIFKCSIIVGAGDTVNMKQDSKYRYKRPFVK